MRNPRTKPYFRARICCYHRITLAPISQPSTKETQDCVKFEGFKCKVFFCYNVPCFVIEACIPCALLHLGEACRREDSYSATSSQLFSMLSTH